ncbi:MAG: M20/M25/M40 family metallo-hydrolase [Clostridia bacterium]|nr:M20/M25/M40 family metallo-hydrolase [Clostridia bacterium]
MMDWKSISDKIDRLNDKYLSVWEDICNIESPTDDKNGVDAVALYVTQLAEKKDWEVEVIVQKVSGNPVCITLNPDADAAPISLSGHMDTVHPVGSFGSPAVRRDETRMYGPGVLDCKGGIVAALLAMDALDQCGFRARPVQLLLQSDEEKGSAPSKKETIRYICEKAKNSVGFLNLEGHTAGAACLARKGIVNFTFTVTGVEAHSSNCAEKGANAIADAAHKILELEKIKDAAGLTCNCGVISGGTVPNTVAGTCEFKANVRFATMEQYEWICDYVQKLAAIEHVKGCSCTVSQTGYRVMMEDCQRNRSLLDTMNRIFEQTGLPCLKASTRKGGSDAADVTAYGIPCVDSLGVEGGKIHTVHEYAELASLKSSAKRIAAVAAFI